MKFLRRFIVLAAIFSVFSCLTFSQTKGKGFKTYGDSLSYALGLEMGNQLFNVMEIEEEYFDYKIFAKAFKNYYFDKELSLDKDSSSVFVEDHFVKREAVKRENWVKDGEALLEANKEKEGVIVTETGLQYKILQKGNGVKPGLTDKVSVHYKGSLQDGKEFDSSYERGTPAEFGVTQVIKGWTEALQLMSVGEKLKIWIPSELAYGERGASTVIPANSILIFEVELLEIK